MPNTFGARYAQYLEHDFNMRFRNNGSGMRTYCSAQNCAERKDDSSLMLLPISRQQQHQQPRKTHLFLLVVESHVRGEAPEVLVRHAYLPARGVVSRRFPEVIRDLGGDVLVGVDPVLALRLQLFQQDGVDVFLPRLESRLAGRVRPGRKIH